MIKFCNFLLLLLIISPAFAQTYTSKAKPIADFKGEIINQYSPIKILGLPNKLDSTFGIEKVCIDLQHEYLSDLKIELVAPNGKSVWLTNRNGKDGPGAYINTCFEYTDFSPKIIYGKSPFSGSYEPEGLVYEMNYGTINPNGLWLLNIMDLKTGHVGRLNSWSITFGNKPFLPPKPHCQQSNFSECVCNSSGEMLPDLIVVEGMSKNLIHFSDTAFKIAMAAANIGLGPLEVKTNGKQTGNDYHLYQAIYHKTDTGFSKTFREAGSIYYDEKPGHNHYHVNDWVDVTLYRYRKFLFFKKEPIEVASLNKISYCLFDNMNCNSKNGECISNGVAYTENNLANYGLGDYIECNKDLQGISVGGIDYYGMNHEGQSIRFEKKLKKGKYYVKIIVDPLNLYLESNEDNNTYMFDIELVK
ncbi:MAG: proprotein convertase P-domain-containing protein [Flavobacteriales bacterium]|nr:proprotein convertase P-domain-containing protein [Flavobacteriales bacterium]